MQPSTVYGIDPKGIAIVKNNFVIKKLGLKDGANLDETIDSVIETNGIFNRNKYRTVMYYLLTNPFKKQLVYN